MDISSAILNVQNTDWTRYPKVRSGVMLENDLYLPPVKRKAMRTIIWSFCLLLLVSSCNKEDDAAAQQLETDIALIDAWLANEGLEAEQTSSGLRYIVEEPGNGTSFPSSSSYVTVAYIGKLLDGTVFDASPGGNPLSFSLSGTIKGWREGIPKFRKGGKGKLLIPSGLAYGAYSPSSKVPANAVLVFDIQLIDFQ